MATGPRVMCTLTANATEIRARWAQKADTQLGDTQLQNTQSEDTRSEAARSGSVHLVMPNAQISAGVKLARCRE
jgi:hypothetical protein